MQSSDMPGALQLVQQWLVRHPNDRIARTALAETQVRGSDFAGARKNFEELVRQSPNDARALNNLANVQLALRDPAAALATAEKALALAPANALVIDSVGWAAFQAGQADKALLLLRDARLREPNNPSIRYHLAAVLAKAGRRSEAASELQAALASNLAFDSRTEASALLQSLK
jgi:Flp pilus assembly protein TadD